MIARVVLAALLVACSLAAAIAAPSRIIILPMAEDAWKLCGVGQERAAALAATYLGRNASKSLFAAGEQPAAFPPSPCIRSSLQHQRPEPGPCRLRFMPRRLWGKEGIRGDAQPAHAAGGSRPDVQPSMAGKTVVMVWEHDHIADAKLEKKFSGEAVTLRQLLHLDTLKGVPDTWPSGNYDYFWIVDFDRGASAPTGFRMVKQCSTALTQTCPPTTGARRTGSRPTVSAI